MVSVDRSREFQQLCAQLGPSMPPTPPPAAATPAVASLSDFHSAASNISHEIYNTSQKLAQLTRLVQQRGKSLFNDPANEISALVHGISEDIRVLNGKLESAQTYVNQKKSQLGDKSQVADHSVQVVGELKSSLISATKSFKDVVKQRQNNVKAQQERKAMFGQGSGSKLQRSRPKVYGNGAAAAGGSPGGSDALALPRPGGTMGSGGGIPGGGGGGGFGGGEMVQRKRYDPSQGQHPHHQQQQQQQQQMQLIPDQSYLAERADAMTEIEGHILELGEVFNRLGSLVEDHREMTERLRDNVDDAMENTEMAHQRLMRTFNQLTSGRSLTYKISAILFFFFVFWVVFLV
mmetsp:Transcript_26847/g.62864  ORF Transcript_26847/g.62864 Transcript_26847/m.62864 type:complete len:348 (-) Transcript_26847:404-1447(-)|eukprot:CAMPEP_0182567128 /NCGR_PEP_ID=MMETSP1324-20130603/8422_1 /TAXON_ID=236786 /ORGANISM="Florenciella sp., Strain RCC1587" /LENGTH=347 /DNA_ID=CAMNT_0024781061 /DNA_START=231 /DNA_END=1274 /DNA_ORIENTATION=-